MQEQEKKSPRDVVETHIEEYCDLVQNHPKTVVGNINNEHQITNDYLGRVLYELLQNAVDRAESKIWIDLCRETRTLTVANDGEPFGIEARTGEPRSDFDALCSINTSNKQAGESIGNKGVGFKSVFEFCDRVQIRSIIKTTKETWGIRLYRSFNTDIIDAWADKELANKIKGVLESSNVEDKHKNKAPSFYFPEYIDSPEWKNEGAVTAVELENLSDDNLDKLQDELERFKTQTLVFVSDIREGINLKLEVSSTKNGTEIIPLYVDERDWLRIDVDVSNRLNDLKEYQEALSYEVIGDPRLSLILPKGDLPKGFKGVIHSYLPTERSLDIPVHVQGDFYLDNSRKNVDLSSNEYNKLLFELAIEGLINRLEQGGDLLNLSYIHKLLLATNIVGDVFDKFYKDKPAILAELLEKIVNARKQHPVSFYNDIFRIIEKYKKLKGRKRKTYDRYEKEDYYPFFCKKSLQIVPILSKTISKDGEEIPANKVLVEKACSLPRPNSKELFCQLESSEKLTIEVILSNIIVTAWSFPSGVKSRFKDLEIWREYNKESLLRVLVDVQGDVESNNEKEKYLQLAQKLDSPEDQYVPITKWRYRSAEPHPIQRLLIPSISGWKKAHRCFINDENNILAKSLDTKKISPIDHEQCKTLLGDNYLSILRHWGVWDVLPLIIVTEKGSSKASLPVTNLYQHEATEELVSKSWELWKKSYNINLDAVYLTLKSSMWLKLKNEWVSPSTLLFGRYGQNVVGYHIINSDSIEILLRNLLEELDVKALEKEEDIRKLSLILNNIAQNLRGNKIDGNTLSVYRKIIKRINQVVTDDTDNNLLDALPIFYAENSNQRRMATEDDTVYYVPESNKHVRKSPLLEDKKWWLANGDVMTLAKKLSKIKTGTSDIKITNIKDERNYEEFREILERDYLPQLFALASYGEVSGIPNTDEETIQEYWLQLVISKVENANLSVSNTFDSNIKNEELTHIEEAGILWNNTDKKGTHLFVHDRADLEMKTKLCQWFAEEIFRHKGFAIHFEKIINNLSSIADYGVSESVLDDAKDIINTWLSDEKIIEVTEQLSEITEKEITVDNWRSSSTYRGCKLSFKELQKKLPDELLIHIDWLNPKLNNQENLEIFLEKKKANMAALMEKLEAVDTNEQIIKSFNNDSLNNSRFDFSPEQWVCNHYQISVDEFKLLGRNLAIEIKQLEKKGVSLIDIEEYDKTESKAYLTDPSSPSTPNRGTLVPTKEQEERAKDNKKRSESGENCEKSFALSVVRKRISLLEQQQLHSFFKLLCDEYQRLAELKDNCGIQAELKELEKMPAQKDQTKWLELIHLGGKCDGVGYDVIDFNAADEKLLLVEVKSSSSIKNHSIYLSDNERTAALYLASEEFKNKFPNTEWRLQLLYRGEDCDGRKNECKCKRRKDITNLVLHEIRERDKSYESSNSKLKATNWMLNGITINN